MLLVALRILLEHLGPSADVSQAAAGRRAVSWPGMDISPLLWQNASSSVLRGYLHG
jgi:hypothetical protein